MGWSPGDRVQLVLADKSARNRDVLVSGTVTEVDPPGMPGVRVRLDRLINGVDNCLATHQELTSL